MPGRWGRRTTAAAVITGLLLAVVSPGAEGVSTSPEPDGGVAAVITRYRREIPRIMAREGVPGLSLVVVDGAGVVWQQGFGVTEPGGSPVTADTPFSVQSVSKVFTATAVMQAVQAGRLDLDAPITRYLPGFTVHSAFEPHPERRITLRMLLSHTSGLTDEAPLGNNYETGAGDFDAHVRSISRTWLRFPAGSGLAYSNLGIDLAGYVLEQVWDEPFRQLMQHSLLSPLGMDHSTFDCSEVLAAAGRAKGRAGLLPRAACSPMVAAGGLWTTAADLGTFLSFQLGDGTIDGRAVLGAAQMKEMRRVAAPEPGAGAGYGLGPAVTRWRDAHNVDLFYHLGGGEGFLADLWWLPQLQLGIAVLTNSYPNNLGTLAEKIVYDLVTEPGSRYQQRLLRVPMRPDVREPDMAFVPPPDLAARTSRLALPRSSEQSRRWVGYAGSYRTGEPGAMDPFIPASRFRVTAGVSYFDAAEDGTPVRHRLTEFRPGLFLADNGEALDLRGPSLYWRGVQLHRVSGGPTPTQWGLLAAVALAAAWWLTSGVITFLRRRRHPSVRPVDPHRAPHDRSYPWRLLTVAVGAVGAAAALATIAGVTLEPGFVDVGFLGRLAFPVAIRLALHLPLALVLSAVVLVTLLVFGAVRRWWTPRLRAPDVALAVALTALASQLALWDLVGWGF